MNARQMHPRLLVALAMVLLLVGCGAGGTAADAGNGASDTASAGSGNTDVEGSDGAAAETAGDAANGDPDASAVDAAWTPNCPGEIGCPCTGPQDCDVPLCLETQQGLRCSTYCGGTLCPPGWHCGGQTADGDATTYCVPDDGLLCRPCTKDSACQAAGHSNARCVDYGVVGAFCGLPCYADSDCPADAHCAEVASVEGGPLRLQCVAGPAGGGLGTCGCSERASSIGAATDCWLDDSSGAVGRRCRGTRSCGSGGLSSCAPLVGSDAVCLDVGCLEVGSAKPRTVGTACDDGRPCTAGDACDGAGLCVGGEQTCPCEPGLLPCPAASNVCAGPLVCEASDAGAAVPFACVAQASAAVVCDASQDTACVKAACTPASGACAPAPIERTAEICDVPKANGGLGCRRERLPESAPSAPAATCDDGLACSTADHCAGGTCVALEDACGCTNDADCKDDGDLCNGTPICDKSGATWSCVVDPATVVSCDTAGDGDCLQTTCQPTTGACSKSQQPVGAPCDDGVACSKGDTCAVDGSCTPGAWTCCKTNADCAAEEDGNLCNGSLFCNAQSGACQLNPLTVVVCPTVDDTDCRKAVCQPATGQCLLTPMPTGTACDDGQPCTSGDSCAGGSCKPGASTCGCLESSDCAAKEDGDLCNGTLYCDPVDHTCKTNPKTVVSCPSVDDTDCRKNVCQAKSGACAMVPLPAGVTCDADGTACTAGDGCDGKGGCVAGKSVCACLADTDCAGQEDGDLCNGVLYCDKSGPTPSCKLDLSSVVSCKSVDDTACSKNLCDPGTGQCKPQLLAKGAPCDDGDLCTGGDTCDGKGTCNAGAALLCGCKTAADCASFDNGDPCLGGYTCKDSGCIYIATKLDCSDGDACTLDACKSGIGCTHVALPGCVSCTANAGCDDGNSCTADFCDGGACSHQNAPFACSDGDACTLVDLCANGACKAGNPRDCTDGSACTADACDASTGDCTHAAAPYEGKGCNDDGNLCTVDVCISGLCPVGPAADCDDDDVCTKDSCEPSKGCVHTSTAASCAQGKECFVDSCDPKLGCKHEQAADGTACGGAASGKVCAAGVCQVPCPPGVVGAACDACAPGYSASEITVGGKKAVACSARTAVWGHRPLNPTTASKKVVSGDTVVVDSQTLLMWQHGYGTATDPKKKHPSLNRADALAYCDGLLYAGFDDWRLPTRAELFSTLKLDHGDPLTATGYLAAASGEAFEGGTPPLKTFWTRTDPVPNEPGPGIVVSFAAAAALVLQLNTSSLHEVRCVRGGGVIRSAKRWEIADQTATDTWTGLVWSRNKGQFDQPFVDNIKQGCVARPKFQGKSWRMPTIRELNSFVDEGLASWKEKQPAFDNAVFNFPAYYNNLGPIFSVTPALPWASKPPDKTSFLALTEDGTTISYTYYAGWEFCVLE